MKYIQSPELLEPRIAPAAMFTYTDSDGDVVTVSSSKGSPADLHAAAVFANAGTLLKTLDLSTMTFGAEFQGAIISITAKAGPGGGDGHVNVGYINATGRDLASVTIAGDLGAIDAGDSDPATPALALLRVGSLGVYGTVTGAPDLQSDIVGSLTSLKVTSDLNQAYVSVTGGLLGKIGAITIGGSIYGGAAMHSGSIEASGDIGAVKIGGGLHGVTDQTGLLRSGGKLTSISIGGSIDSVNGQFSGAVVAQNIGAVTVGGSVTGGNEPYSGLIQSTMSDIDSVKIGGSLLGGLGGGLNGTVGVKPSGGISAAGNLGAVTIAGSLVGGGGIGSGSVMAGGFLTSLFVGGSVLGVGPDSGLINVGGETGPVHIGGDLRAGFLALSGVSQSGAIEGHGLITSVYIGGSLIGTSPGSLAGVVKSDAWIGPVTIGGSIVGGNTTDSGEVMAPRITSIKIGGSLESGTGAHAGEVRTTAGPLGSVTIAGSASGLITVAGDLPTVKITGGLSGRIASTGKLGKTAIGLSVSGDLEGGSVGPVTIGGGLSGNVITTGGGDMGAISVHSDLTGEIFSQGRITSATIGGSILGGATAGKGVVVAAGDIGLVQIGGDVRGGTHSGTGVIHAISVTAGKPSITKVTIGGSLIRGFDFDTGDIYADGNLGSVRIGGDIRGGGMANVNLQAGYIRAQGNIGSLTVGGHVEFSTILAGYTNTTVASNGDAQIGPVKIGGDWIASNLVAGAKNANAPLYGVSDTAIGGGLPAIIATIASITIGGQVVGTSTSISDNFGFVAEKIGAFRIGDFVVPLTAGKDTRNVGYLNDVTIHEV